MQSTDWGKKYGENIHLAKDCYAKNEKNSVTSVIKRQTTRLKMDKKFEHLLLNSFLMFLSSEISPEFINTCIFT